MHSGTQYGRWQAPPPAHGAARRGLRGFFALWKKRCPSVPLSGLLLCVPLLGRRAFVSPMLDLLSRGGRVRDLRTQTIAPAPPRDVVPVSCGRVAARV